MKKRISLLLAAVLLSAACIAPVGADSETPEEPGTLFDPASVAAMSAARDAAGFVNDYVYRNKKAEWIENTVAYFSEAYPDAVSYKDAEMTVPVVSVSDAQIEESIRRASSETPLDFSKAPENFFGTVVKSDLAAYFDAAKGCYALTPPASTTPFADLDFAGIVREDDVFRVYFAVREKEYLSDDDVTDKTLTEIESGGKTYVRGEDGRYVYEGAFAAQGVSFGLRLTASGFSLISQSVGAALPATLAGVPEPDGDANGDCKLNARDVTALMKALVGDPPAAFNSYAADFHFDSKLNARDVTALMKLIVASAEPPKTEDPPVEDPPAEDPPAEDPPVVNPPVVDPPVKGLPAETVYEDGYVTGADGVKRHYFGYIDVKATCYHAGGSTAYGLPADEHVIGVGRYDGTLTPIIPFGTRCYVVGEYGDFGERISADYGYMFGLKIDICLYPTHPLWHNFGWRDMRVYLLYNE